MHKETLMGLGILPYGRYLPGLASAAYSAGKHLIAQPSWRKAYAPARAMIQTPASTWTNTTTKNVRRIVNKAIEKQKTQKYMDETRTLFIVGTNLATNNVFFALNLTRQGSGAFERIGNRIKLESLRIKFVASLGTRVKTTGAATYEIENNTVRAIVLWDTEGDGAAIPTFDFIFGTISNTGVNDGTMLSPVRPQQSHRFRVLKDVMINAPTITPYAPNDVGSYTSTSAQKVGCDWFIDLSKKNMHTDYAGTSVAPLITDITGGTLLMCFIEDQTTFVPSNNNPSYSTISQYVSRLKFVDI